MNDIINRLIIAAGQWQQFKDEQYKRQFDALFKQLQWITNTNYDDATELLLAAINGEVAA